MERPRKPAYRSKAPKFYEKPLYFVHGKWQTFRGFSRRKKLAILGGTAATFLILVPVLSYLYFVRDISDPERLMNRNSTGITITDRNGETIYSYGRIANKKLYKLDEISDQLEKAVLASEDKDFYEHGGFSLRSIFGAFVANILNKDLTKYGGSTLTQQLVKNNLLTNNKNFFRKYQELSISIAIERNYTKDEILEMYLNSVYYGEGAFGIEQAAKTYFDKTPQDLTLAESTMLVGLLPAPSAYSPVSGDPELSEREQERVLKQMADIGYITEQEKTAALEQNLSYAEIVENVQLHGQHFTGMVLEELRERYGEERVTRSGFSVKTTIDLNAQKQAEQTVKDKIASITGLGATNGALVAIDTKTGEIRALVGSANWDDKQFGQVNMAITPRQPGSSFKPIYYAEALEKRLITPATVIRDEKKTYGDYRPENYDFRYRGDITIRYALAQSLNIPAIEVMQKLGVDEAAEAARKMGISTVDEPEKYGLTLALGTAETKLMDMTNAYAAFANGGMQHKAASIISIQDKYGKTIFSKKSDPTRVQSAEASYQITSILSDQRARAPLSGSAFNLAGREVAVKTGTTNDNVDAWTIGYTPSLAVGVWVGDNTHKPMQLGGTTGAGPIWRTTMQNILGDSTAETFPRPGRIVQQALCSVNGSYQEYYIRGTQPSNPCRLPSQAEIDAARRNEEKEEEDRKKREEEDRKKQQEKENEDDEPVVTPPPVEPPDDDEDNDPPPSPTPTPTPVP